MGTKIVETGTLLLIDGRLALRRDLGGRWSLDLDPAPVEMHEKRVKIIGTIVADGQVDVHGIVAVHG